LLNVDRMNPDVVLKYLVRTHIKWLMVTIACPNQSLSSIKPYLSTRLNLKLNAYEQKLL